MTEETGLDRSENTGTCLVNTWQLEEGGLRDPYSRPPHSSHPSLQTSTPVHGLHPKPLLDTGAQCLLVVQAAEADEHSVLMGLVFFPARVDFGDQGIKVGVWP